MNQLYERTVRMIITIVIFLFVFSLVACAPPPSSTAAPAPTASQIAEKLYDFEYFTITLPGEGWLSHQTEDQMSILVVPPQTLYTEVLISLSYTGLPLEVIDYNLGEWQISYTQEYAKQNVLPLVMSVDKAQISGIAASRVSVMLPLQGYNLFQTVYAFVYDGAVYEIGVVTRDQQTTNDLEKYAKTFELNYY